MFQQQGQPLSIDNMECHEISIYNVNQCQGSCGQLQALSRYIRVVTGEEIITKRLWI